jgi:hypothetical protein
MHPTTLTSSQKGVFYEEQIYGDHVRLRDALLLLGMTTVFAAASPNYATNTHEDMSLYYYGYVQCQPSYVENGNHAARGYIRYWRYDLLGNVVNDTGRLYTAYGNGPDDGRILSRSYTYTIQTPSFPIRAKHSLDTDSIGYPMAPASGL